MYLVWTNMYGKSTRDRSFKSCWGHGRPLVLPFSFSHAHTHTRTHRVEILKFRRDVSKELSNLRHIFRGNGFQCRWQRGLKQV